MNISPYNATVTEKIMISPDLMILRIEADDPRDEFDAGQYLLLGLFASEIRSKNSEPEDTPVNPEKLIQRPYTIVSARTERKQFEFFISQIKSGKLSPRLFNLEPGRRLHICSSNSGIFRLDETPEGSDIIMLATGTGISPYISFLRSHIVERPESKMIVIQGARHRWDLGYNSELEFLEQSYANFFYVPTLTDADDQWKGQRMSIEDLLKNDFLQNEFNISPDPERTHFFVCGNPEMVANVSDWLLGFGYRKHHPDNPGELYIEEF
ncbi:MAG: ferredoxin--NADP reductase [Chlorobiaceae bacterium]|nr:ferredoxin--NADP reductase [Chlorobiaceae bacterium]NTV61761.1 ferredoxin--NADP reductase [Chlorobiaceae bacterium]